MLSACARSAQSWPARPPSLGASAPAPLARPDALGLRASPAISMLCRYKISLKTNLAVTGCSLLHLALLHSPQRAPRLEGMTRVSLQAVIHGWEDQDLAPCNYIINQLFCRQCVDASWSWKCRGQAERGLLPCIGGVESAALEQFTMSLILDCNNGCSLHGQ